MEENLSKETVHIIHESGEDYLEKILMLQEQTHAPIRSIDLANAFDFSRPAISKAIKLLSKNGFVEVTNGYLHLTDLGLKRAKDIYHRHRILKDFFIKIGVNDKIADHDACKIEHDIHESTFLAIEKLLEKIN